MPRPPRIEFENAWYHVMNRGAGKRVVFPTDNAYELFLELVAEIANEFQLEVHAYCLMSNHFHLLVRTPYANLNLAMQKLTSIYTRRHNRELKTDGPLFRGRYKALLIAQEGYLSHVSRYIHRNPVEAKIVQAADCYRWSSYKAYCDAGSRSAWLQTTEMVRLVSPQSRPREYVQFVENNDIPSMSEFYNSKRWPGVLGAKDVRRMLASQAQYQSQWQPKNRATISAIMEGVSKSFAVDVDHMLNSVRGKLNIPRAAAMYLAQVVGAYPAHEIAVEFGIGASAVTQTIFRLRGILEKEPDLAHKIERLKQVLVGA